MPPRKQVSAGPPADAFAASLAELYARVDELSRLNGLPPLQSRAVVPIDDNRSA